MILQRANFNVPARFSFQPFIAEWRFAMAETMEWARDPTRLRMAFVPADDDDDKNWLQVRIEVPDDRFGIPLGVDPPYTVLMNRASIPPDVLRSHENHRNTPDVSGRSFSVLIYRNPEIKNGLWALEPGKIEKNAKIMLDEFVNLEKPPQLGWDLSVQQFLNKWGLWCSEQRYVEAWDSASAPQLTALFSLMTKQRTDTPDFLMVMPHLLKEQQERYSKALLPKSARPWLRSHPLHPLKFSTADEFPFFRVRTSYCRDAIEVTITIDHLAGIRSGICKRCYRVFEKEKKYRMSYCSRSCANAASVERFRKRKRKASTKGGKHNAKG